MSCIITTGGLRLIIKEFKIQTSRKYFEPKDHLAHYPSRGLSNDLPGLQELKQRKGEDLKLAEESLLGTGLFHKINF